jgi:hypothetical protein
VLVQTHIHRLKALCVHHLHACTTTLRSIARHSLEGTPPQYQTSAFCDPVYAMLELHFELSPDSPASRVTWDYVHACELCA